jgi:hypothetical protein
VAKKARLEDDLGIVVPQRTAVQPMSVRLTETDLRKLGALAQRLKVGPSTLARLIVEKFIKEHDPDR